MKLSGLSMVCIILSVFTVLSCREKKQELSDEEIAQARYLTGIGHMREGLFGDAVLELRASIELDAQRVEAHHSLGEAYIGVQRPRDAEQSFRWALNLEPEKYMSHLGLGHALRLQGRSQEAVDAYREASKLEPELAEPHSFIGEVFQRAGDDKSAAEAFAEAARLTPPEERAIPLHRTARAMLASGEHEKSEQMFEQVSELIPDDVEIWLGLAETRVRQGKLEKAGEAYKRASALVPTDTITLQLLAAIYEALGKDNEAVELYDRALAFEPENSRIWEGYARLHLAFDRKSKAVDAAEKSLEYLDGKNVHMIRAVAELLADIGDAKRSAELYRLLLLENEEDPHLWLGLARQLQKLERKKDFNQICRQIKSLSDGKNGKRGVVWAEAIEFCHASERED